MKQLWELGYFLRSVRAKMRYGEYSRAPLRLLRFEWRGETAECDWMARASDEWDVDLPRKERERIVSLQALRDAIALRDILFSALSDVREAELRSFRQSAREPPELILFGTVMRESPTMEKVTSPVMRAKLCGFQFHLVEEVLRPLEIERENLRLMISA
jgi:hypothetical protein